MIELGGKIFLQGFEILDQAEILVAKKLVGGYIRLACDEAGCERADLTLEPAPEGYKVTVRAVRESGEAGEGAASGCNVFLTIDAAMKGLLEQLEVAM